MLRVASCRSDRNLSIVTLYLRRRRLAICFFAYLRCQPRTAVHVLVLPAGVRIAKFVVTSPICAAVHSRGCFSAELRCETRAAVHVLRVASCRSDRKFSQCDPLFAPRSFRDRPAIRFSADLQYEPRAAVHVLRVANWRSGSQNSWSRHLFAPLLILQTLKCG